MAMATMALSSSLATRMMTSLTSPRSQHQQQRYSHSHCSPALTRRVSVPHSTFLCGSSTSLRSTLLQKTQNFQAGRCNSSGGITALSIPWNEGTKSLAVAVGIPLVLGVVDALFNSPGTKWYFELKKPRWQPPSFLFGGAWSVLYPLMGLASWLVWAEGGWAKQAYPLTLYAVQLAFNLAWPALFFGAKNLGGALVDIICLDVALIATVLAFKPVNEVAANLLKPYLAWVLFATALNYKLWDLNKSASSGQPSPA